SSRCSGGGDCWQKLDLRAGDEIVLLAGDQDDRARVRVVSGPLQQTLELGAHLRGQRVYRLAGLIDGDHRHAVLNAEGEPFPRFQLLNLDRHHARSRITAAPRPPAAHTVHIAVLFPRRLSSCNAWRTTRAPVAAKGWPRAIEPPVTLRRLRSTSPSGAERPALRANSSEAKACRLEAT